LAEVRYGRQALPEYRDLGAIQYKWQREYELHISHYDPVPALFSA